jgi:putative oxidoreductase
VDTVDTQARTSSLADLGLVLLRFATGAAMLQAGLIKALDFGKTVDFMVSNGWRLPKFAAGMVTATETVGGLLLLLGLLTPLAACAIVAAMLDAWAVNVAGGAFWSDPFNVPFMVAFGALTLLFTGAGVYSLDARLFGRARWPGVIAVGLFLVAVAAGVATWVLLNGTNPIHLGNPTG